MSNIAVFGYFNAGNTGDDRLAACATRFAVENSHSLTFLWHHNKPNISFLREFDYLLIGGGGLAFRRVGVWRDVRRWVRAAGVPVGVWGLGIPTVPPELKPELVALADVASFFYVRDERSRAMLDNHKNVEAHTDLSWSYPLPAGREPVPGRIALNVFPTTWLKSNVSPNDWADRLISLGGQITPWPLSFGLGRDRDALAARFGRPAVAEEFDPAPLRTCELLVAARYHAIVFAMQLSVPFVAILYDSKVRQLLAEGGLADLGLEPDESGRLAEKVEYVRGNTADILRRIDDFATKSHGRAKLMMARVADHLATPKPLPLWAKLRRRLSGTFS